MPSFFLFEKFIQQFDSNNCHGTTNTDMMQRLQEFEHYVPNILFSVYIINIKM